MPGLACFSTCINKLLLIVCAAIRVTQMDTAVDKPQKWVTILEVCTSLPQHAASLALLLISATQVITTVLVCIGIAVWRLFN